MLQAMELAALSFWLEILVMVEHWLAKGLLALQQVMELLALQQVMETWTSCLVHPILKVTNENVSR